MAEKAVVDELAQEARDLMPVGGFGLYEFIWTLNGTHPAMSLPEKLAVAKAALTLLVQEDHAKIVLYGWPPGSELGQLTLEEINDSHFQSPEDGLAYAAVVPSIRQHPGDTRPT
jgi:hypothetical protein